MNLCAGTLNAPLKLQVTKMHHIVSQELQQSSVVSATRKQSSVAYGKNV